VLDDGLGGDAEEGEKRKERRERGERMKGEGEEEDKRVTEAKERENDDKHTDRQTDPGSGWSKL
jgi:hypothetical protein